MVQFESPVVSNTPCMHPVCTTGPWGGPHAVASRQWHGLGRRAVEIPLNKEEKDDICEDNEVKWGV